MPRKSVASEPTSTPLQKMGGFALTMGALYLLICFLSYHPGDPSFNHAGGGEVANVGGYFGALTADLALQLLGLSASLAVLVPFTWGVKLMIGRPVSHIWLRATMLMVGMVLMAALLSPITPFQSWPVESGFGGSIGGVLHSGAKGLFSNILFKLFLFAGTFFTVAMAFGMTVSEWRSMGFGVKQAAMVVCGVVVSAVIAWRERREARAQEEDEDEEEEYEEEDEYYEEDEYEEDEESDEDEDEDEEEEEPWYRRAASAVAEKIFFWRRESDEYEDEDEDEEEEEDEDEEAEYEEEEEEEKPKKKPAKKPAKVHAQPSLALPKGDYMLPALTLLAAARQSKKSGMNEAALQQNARLLETTLQDFGVQGSITEIRPGPVVTLYELEPAAGVKSSRVIGLADDIARSMSAVSARIAVIPGRNAIGIELPNATRETVYLRELIENGAFEDSEARLPLALGKDIGGAPIIVDLARMPHLLVAGTTGSGKSVAINTMIMSLVYKLSPEECKFIMIDPKMLELSVYDGIPHLLTPVVTEPGKAVVALKWTVKEMENRYRLMANLGVRNIDGYNKQIREAKAKGKQLSRRVQTGFDPETGQPIIEEVPLDMMELPFIVVIVDEMADLMLVAGKDIEGSIQRLAQMARAAGIHIIMATQRPSVDVITGVIKANFPTRISFQVTSRIDSRTILGEQGAEQLLGQGDMLYMAGGGRITRVHGPFASDKEVETVIEHLKEQGTPTYIEDVTREEDESGDMFGGGEGERDELYDKAVAVVARDRKASTSYVQRQLKIGYNRAASIIERMEREGIVSPANHVGKREVLARESA